MNIKTTLLAISFATIVGPAHAGPSGLPEATRDQKMAPCNNYSTQVEINGACWWEQPEKPPCREQNWMHSGRCYSRVLKPKR